MISRFATASVFCLSLFAGSFAEDNCKDPKTSYDRTYCAAKLFLESDKELNAVYKELKGMLKPEVQKKLVQVQRDWIKYRDNQCESNGTINVDCNHNVNVARIDFLRERLRECKAGQARPDLIEKQSW
ncbi:MAG TPA: lysozyme inhibitor LprI family protein [Fibrobacteria bacterium]|nr:lysozyme inhibitor LprI family protein [Fibrobacteria bacterium]